MYDADEVTIDVQMGYRVLCNEFSLRILTHMFQILKIQNLKYALSFFNCIIYTIPFSKRNAYYTDDRYINKIKLTLTHTLLLLHYGHAHSLHFVHNTDDESVTNGNCTSDPHNNDAIEIFGYVNRIK